MTDAVPICVNCRAPSVGRFEITRFDRHGTNKGTTIACSIKCLLTWAYNYAAMAGMMTVANARTTITQIIDSLKGKRT